MPSGFPSAEAYAAEPARHPPLEVVDLLREAATVTSDYANSVLVEVGTHCLRLAVFEGEYRWHFHPDSDELFLVVDGELLIEFADRAACRLTAWQCIVVPAGTVHRTTAIGRTTNLTFEERGAGVVFVQPPIATERTGD